MTGCPARSVISQWNSNLQYCSAEPRPSLERIESETEPPNLATETNAGGGVFWARNPQSPVRMRQSLTAKTPRNRGDFSGCARVRAGSLCNSRLSGGASRIRTLSTPWRMESESEPPNLATEKNTGNGVFDARNPQSPVRMREAPRPKPRGIAGFSRPPRALTEKSLRRQTRWRREWDSNPRYLSVHTLSKRAP